MSLKPTVKSAAGKQGKNPKSVYMTIGVWYDPAQGHIHMTSADTRFRHTTVTDRPGKRCHPNLFGKLKAVLKGEGVWAGP